MSSQASAAKYRKYSPTKVAAAVSAVKDGGMSKRKASVLYGIPRTTLIDKLSGKAPVGSIPGKPCVLTSAEELVLVDYIKLMGSIGYPLKRRELCHEVKQILDHDGRKTPFRENLPGKHWCQLFFQRHPTLSERSAMALGHQRSLISFDMVEGWFNGLTSYLKSEVPDWETLVKDPRLIFNADESGFPLSVTNGKVLVEKGVRHVYQVCTSNKTQITVLACFNAIGNYIPPLIVYPGERFRDSGIQEFEEAIYGHTSSGWMDSELFVAYLRHFNEYVVENQIPKPVLLLVDGHSAHMSLEAAQFCSENRIVLYCLLQNSTHVLQPCDVGFFSPLKAAWKKEVKVWQLDHLGQALTKKQFPGVFKKAWHTVAKLENAVHGFQKCGLFPLNPRNIDLTKLNPSKIMTRDNGDMKVDSQQKTNDRQNDESHSKEPILVPKEQTMTRLQEHTEQDIEQQKVTETEQHEQTEAEQLEQTEIEQQEQEKHSNEQTKTKQQKETVVQEQTDTRPLESKESGQQSETRQPDQTTLQEHTDKRLDKQFESNQMALCSRDDTSKVSHLAYITQTRGQTVSPSFALLSVPEVKKKTAHDTIRTRLPKALSGKDALKIFQDRENAKKEKEIAKQKRIQERLAKKEQKLIEKEQKRMQREETKRKKEQAKLVKLAMDKSRKRKNRDYSSSSDTDDDDQEPKLMDSEEEFDESQVCPGCRSDEGSPLEWIACTTCNRRWHITCTGDAILLEVPEDVVQNYPYLCELCM